MFRKTESIWQLMQNLQAHLASGGNTDTALKATLKQDLHKKFAEILNVIHRDVQKGIYLHESMKKYPDFFDQTIINIIAVGELSGQLPTVVDQTIKLLEQRQKLSQQLLTATLYPLFILSTIGALGLVVTFFVLPKLIPLFSSLEVSLPFSTRLLLGIAELITEHPLSLVAFAIFVFFAIAKFITSVKLKAFRDKLVIKLPFIGKTIRNSIILNQLHDLVTLIRSNVDLYSAVVSVTKTTNNTGYYNVLKKIATNLKAGGTFAQNLNQFPDHYPQTITNIIQVGESNGKLKESLDTTVDRLEQELNSQIKNLTIALEPLLLILVGLVMLFVAVAITTPIYRLTGNI